MKSLELFLVVPTRNEADNVPVLMRELRESLSGLDYRVVFVDDSTDETPEVIRSLCEENGRLTLIHREGTEREGGLSTAVTIGIEVCVGISEYTCVMDADLQHPPEKVREMLEVARSSDADVVVASRYAQGGRYTGLPGSVRRGISVESKYLAQIAFKEARKTSDPMAGLFLVCNEALEYYVCYNESYSARPSSDTEMISKKPDQRSRLRRANVFLWSWRVTRTAGSGAMSHDSSFYRMWSIRRTLVMMLVGFAVFLGACGQQGQPKENQPAQGDTAGQQQPQEEGAAQAPKCSQEREKGAFIKATPAPVPVGGKTGTTTISWSTGSEASSGEVYVVLDGGSEKLFAGESPEGSAEAPWIFEGGTYVFRLYAGTEQATLLDQVKVTTSEQARESTTK